mgnify:FL=1|tara:strand:+ start:87 stop:413 length:327 start_codon:yes stop_codon:yes gene_type:complete
MSWKNIIKNTFPMEDKEGQIKTIESAKPFTNVKDFVSGLGNKESPNPFWKIMVKSIKGELNTMDDFISYMDEHYYVRDSISEPHARIVKTLLEGSLDAEIKERFNLGE